MIGDRASLTPAEFRTWVNRYSAQPTVTGRVQEVAESFGWEPRRVHSWYYGERLIPLHIAAIIRPVRLTRRASAAVKVNAAVLLLSSELDRLADFEAAVQKLCRECEVSGECRMPDCPVRSVSPFPLKTVKA